MIPIPGKRLLYILIIPLIFILGSIYMPVLRTVALLLNFSILAVSLFDILLLVLNKNKIDLEYNDKQIFNISCSNTLDLDVYNKSSIKLYIEYGVDLPRFWEQLSELSSEELLNENKRNLKLELKPYRRGLYNFKTFRYRIHSVIGFFYIYKVKDINIEVEVYPDFTGVKEYLKLTRVNRLSELGIHKNRYKGSGTELESLREYSQDDDAKYIDWKASSRLNRPVTKQFQLESQNDIVIVLDCGRLMSGEQHNLSTLDHGINGVLTLAHVALSLGDNLRIIAFSDKIHGDLKSIKGGNKIKKIIKFLTPLQPRFIESNYELVFSYIRKSVGKRSLVLFISDLIDDINYDMFKGNFVYLSKKHRILFLLLKDTLLDRESYSLSATTDDFYNLSAARSMFMKRHSAIARLKKSGIDVLDVIPSEVSGKIIDKYLSLKSRNSL